MGGGNQDEFVRSSFVKGLLVTSWTTPFNSIYKLKSSFFSPRRLFYDLLSYFLALLCAINGNLHKDHQGCVAEDTFSSVCVL